MPLACGPTFECLSHAASPHSYVQGISNLVLPLIDFNIYHFRPTLPNTFFPKNIYNFKCKFKLLILVLRIFLVSNADEEHLK